MNKCQRCNIESDDLIRVEVFAYNVWMVCRQCEILFNAMVDNFFEKKIEKRTVYWNEAEKKSYVDMDDGRGLRELEQSDWLTELSDEYDLYDECGKCRRCCGCSCDLLNEKK